MSVRKMPEQKPGRSKQDYKTPREFLDAVEARWGKLTFDLAANASNSVTGSRYWNTYQDSLSAKRNWQHKNLGPNLWLNPPFGKITPWAKKCSETVGKKIFFLVPASVGSNWYKDFCHDVASVYYLSPRLSFDGKAPFPKDIMLAVYGTFVGRHICWRWDSP
jgi:phage N-6-adenine-methyltransferase